MLKNFLFVICITLLSTPICSYSDSVEEEQRRAARHYEAAIKACKTQQCLDN